MVGISGKINQMATDLFSFQNELKDVSLSEDAKDHIYAQFENIEEVKYGFMNDIYNYKQEIDNKYNFLGNLFYISLTSFLFFTLSGFFYRRKRVHCYFLFF